MMTPRTMELTTPSFLLRNGTNGRLGGEGHDELLMTDSNVDGNDCCSREKVGDVV